MSEIVPSPPLGKSDHDVLTFEFHCYVDYSKPKERYMFHKGNYEAMRKNLIDSKWIEGYIKESNKPGVKPEELWISFKTKLDVN